MLHSKAKKKTHTQMFIAALKPKRTQMHINWKMNKLTVVYPYNGTLFSCENDWGIDMSYNMDEPWKCAMWKSH